MDIIYFNAETKCSSKLMFCITLIIGVCILLYVLYRLFYNEQFTDFVLVDDDKTMNIVMDDDDYDSKLSILTKNKKYKIINDTTSSQDLFYDDSLGFSQTNSNSNDSKYIVAVSDDKKHVCFIQDVSLNQRPNVKMLTDAKIGILHKKDIVILKCIFACYGLGIKSDNCILYPSIQDANTAVFVNKNISALFLFANFKNPSVINAYKNKKLSLFDFDDIDVDKMRVFLPHASVIDFDFHDVFPKYMDRFTVKRTLSFDNVLYTYTKSNNYLLDFVIQIFETNYYFVNYYHQYFNIHPRTLELLQGKDSFAMNVEKRSILEQFSNQNEGVISFNANETMNGFYDRLSNIFTMNGTTINGSSINVDDTIKLGKQKHKIENGTYKVKGIDLVKQTTTLLKSVYEPVPKIVDDTDPRYICTDISIKNKPLCLSQYDTAGNKKKTKEGIWDRPCDYDEECPFFQANKLYKNYRGGCNDGYCEMPIGINRIAFRQFEGNPVCHSCSNMDPNCCENQEYPDYAFILDEYERLPKTNVEDFVQDPKHLALYGDYDNVSNTNVYHYEISNQEFNDKLQILKNVPFDVSNDGNFKLATVLQEKVGSEALQDDAYNLYNISVATKYENDTSDTYEVFTTVYKQGKSHGKRVYVLIAVNNNTSIAVIQDIYVEGVVPEQEITQPNVAIGVSNSLQSFGKKCFQPGISSDPIFEIPNASAYLCDRALKLKQDLNIDVDCTYKD